MIGIYILLLLAMLVVIKFCKKILKIILGILIILITIYCVILNIDMNMVKSCREPIFAKENGHMGSMIRYDGFGYKVGLEKNSNGDITDGQLTMLNFYLVQVHRQIDYIDPINNNENSDFENNTSESCFLGKIIESNANTIIVEPNEDEEIRKSADRIAIGLKNTDELYMVGTGVKITYDGVIMETYPAQINATKIDLKLAENFEIIFSDRQPWESYKLYTILEKNKADNYNYTIYGYDGIVNIKIDDKEYSLKDALLQNKITMNEIIAKANQDEEDGKIEAEMYKDGGSKVYHYENYTIIKCHTVGGNRDVYIGTKDLKLTDVI